MQFPRVTAPSSIPSSYTPASPLPYDVAPSGRWARYSPTLVPFSLRARHIQRCQGMKRASCVPEHNRRRRRGWPYGSAPRPECVRVAATKALMRRDTGGDERSAQHGSVAAMDLTQRRHLLLPERAWLPEIRTVAALMLTWRRRDGRTAASDGGGQSHGC
jgi:hypothetical protein